MNAVKQNSLRAWVLAARPKTLAGAAAPVIIGGSYAWMRIAGEGQGSFDWTVFGLCMLFAWIMQIDANFVNDYFDFRKGGTQPGGSAPNGHVPKGGSPLRL